jgi:hypothetical protein
MLSSLLFQTCLDSHIYSIGAYRNVNIISQIITNDFCNR